MSNFLTRRDMKLLLHCSEKMAHPAQTRELDEDENDQPLVRSDCNADSEEDDRPLVQSTSMKEPVEEKRESAARRRVPTQVRRKSGAPLCRDPSTSLEPDVSGNSREQSEEVSIKGRNPDGEALLNIIKMLADEGNWRDLHLKQFHMSAAQFNKRTIHLDIPGRIYDLYQHVVKTCPFCSSTMPRLDK